MPDAKLPESGETSVKIALDPTTPAEPAALNRTDTNTAPESAAPGKDAARTVDGGLASATGTVPGSARKPPMLRAEVGIALVLGFTLAVLGALWVISPTKSALDPSRCEYDPACAVRAG